MIKKIVLFVFFLMSTFLVFSQNRGAVLNVFSEREPFFLFINDILYNKEPLTKIRVENIPNYTYNVRVEFDSRRRGQALLPNLRMFNELGQGLDVMLMAETPNKLFLYSLFPTGMNIPNTRSFPVFFYDNPRKPDNNTGYYDEISPAEFDRILSQIKRESFDKDKLATAQLMLHNASLSVAQISAGMKVFSWDDAKLDFAKSQFDNCLNKGGYFSLLDLLTFKDAKDKLTTFMKERSKYVKYPSRMSKGEFDIFLKQIKNQSFDKDKTSLISSVCNAFSFSIPEIRSIMKLCSFDEDKLKIAELLYSNCSDKRTYYSLADELVFESRKKELQGFLRKNIDN